MIKIIFFDFDLTLVNSMPGAKATYYSLCRITKQNPTRNGFKQYVGTRFSKMIDNLHNLSGTPRKELTDAYNNIYESKIPEMRFYGKDLFPKLKGIKIAILTNNNGDAVKKVCKYFKIRYDYLIADENMEKDDKKHNAVIKLLKKLKFKHSEALYVGDHINDVIEAHRAGIKSVIVPTGVFKKLYIMKYHPDFMVSSINKVEELVK